MCPFFGDPKRFEKAWPLETLLCNRSIEKRRQLKPRAQATSASAAQEEEEEDELASDEAGEEPGEQKQPSTRQSGRPTRRLVKKEKAQELPRREQKETAQELPRREPEEKVDERARREQQRIVPEQTDDILHVDDPPEVRNEPSASPSNTTLGVRKRKVSSATERNESPSVGLPRLTFRFTDYNTL